MVAEYLVVQDGMGGRTVNDVTSVNTKQVRGIRSDEPRELQTFVPADRQREMWVVEARYSR